MTPNKRPFPLPGAPLPVMEGSGVDCMNLSRREMVSSLPEENSPSTLTALLCLPEPAEDRTASLGTVCSVKSRVKERGCQQGALEIDSFHLRKWPLFAGE